MVNSQIVGALGEKKYLGIVFPGSFLSKLDVFSFLSLLEVLRGWDSWELRTSLESSELKIRRLKTSWRCSSSATFNCSFPVHAGEEVSRGFLAQALGKKSFILSGTGWDGLGCTCRRLLFLL